MKHLLFVLFVLAGTTSFSKTTEKVTKIRIGWQVPWAIQGQIVQILKHTDILKKNNIEAEFIGKTAGPELNELALANQVDLILTADQPASVLFMKNNEWMAISRLMYNRTSTYVPLNSKINSIADLKDKQVGVPFGTAAQRIVNEAVEQNKVTGVQFVNLGMLEHAPLIDKSKPEDTKWGDFDALSGFDPIPAVLEYNKKVKTIHKGKVCALVVINKNFVNQNKAVAKNFVKAVRQAYEYYVKNMNQVNTWFIEEAKLTNVNPAVFDVAAEYEPNLKKGEKIRTSLNDEDMALIQKAADFVSKTTKKEIKISDFVTNKFQ